MGDESVKELVMSQSVKGLSWLAVNAVCSSSMNTLVARKDRIEASVGCCYFVSSSNVLHFFKDSFMVTHGQRFSLSQNMTGKKNTRRPFYLIGRQKTIKGRKIKWVVGNGPNNKIKFVIFSKTTK